MYEYALSASAPERPGGGFPLCQLPAASCHMPAAAVLFSLVSCLRPCLMSAPPCGATPSFFLPRQTPPTPLVAPFLSSSLFAAREDAPDALARPPADPPPLPPLASDQRGGGGGGVLPSGARGLPRRHPCSYSEQSQVRSSPSSHH